MDARRGISRAVLAVPESVTHGSAQRIASLNAGLPEDERVVDLSIGTLDEKADPRIDAAVVEFVRDSPEVAHAFAPVRGFGFLRESVAARVARLHGVVYDPASEILVSPGGVKGSISVTFHALLNPGDEVVVPIPNWPHYADMIALHEAVTVPVDASVEHGLTAPGLAGALTDRTKLLVLGDCVNPTGKVYTTAELTALARVVAEHNARREAAGRSPVHVLFDCPYEAHVPGDRARTFAAVDVELDGGGRRPMRPYTTMVTGPGKTYGMHGDRIGYLCGPADVVEAAARAQVNLTSFAGTYGQVATHAALRPEMDEVADRRARVARSNLDVMFDLLAAVPWLRVRRPDGGYFLFVDLSACAEGYRRLGHRDAQEFLLGEARVATLSGRHFAAGADRPDLDHVVRINCGRSAPVLTRAGKRIVDALTRLPGAG